MRHLLKIIPLLGLLLAGCSAQRTTVKGDVQQHTQALEALENGRFRIEVTSVLPNGKDPVSTTDSYISMRDGVIDMQFSQDFPVQWGAHSRNNLDGKQATIIPAETRRNGDRKFEITVPQTNYSQARLLVTLFSGTNECYVLMKTGSGYGHSETGARGRVTPLAE